MPRGVVNSVTGARVQSAFAPQSWTARLGDLCRASTTRRHRLGNPKTVRGVPDDIEGVASY